MNLLKGLSKQILEKKGREPTCVFMLIRMEICISFHIHIPVLSTPVCILHLNICSLSGGLGEANPGGGDPPEQILQPVEEAAREGDPAGDFWQGKGNYQTQRNLPVVALLSHYESLLLFFIHECSCVQALQFVFVCVSHKDGGSEPS